VKALDFNKLQQLSPSGSQQVNINQLQTANFKSVRGSNPLSSTITFNHLLHFWCVVYNAVGDFVVAKASTLNKQV
jgi:hypothetical protein